jgi:adenine-specific DNA-methyltransferase
MSQNKLQKLELTWIGKGDEPKLEPRILIENPEYSYGDPKCENMLIHGDNLLALKALEQDYAGKVKCIYIDPPYNTGQAFEFYDDGLETSIWLSLMYQRLKILKRLLHKEGVIFIQIDDNYFAHLRLIMDEIFTNQAFLNVITLKTKNSSGASGGGEDKRLKKNTEFLLCYCNKDFDSFNDQYDDVELSKYLQQMRDDEKSFKYTTVLTKVSDKEYFKTIKDGSGNDIVIYRIGGYETKSINRLAQEDKITEIEAFEKYFDKIYTTENAQTSIRTRVQEATDEENNMYLIEYYPISGRNKNKKTEIYFVGPQKRLVSWFKNVCIKKGNKIYKREKIGTLWSDLNWNNVTREGGVRFPNGQKPEILISRCIELVTNEGDYVLDSFLGSGSTAAVAHKMKRKWIGVELGEHAKTHCYTRMKSIIKGQDTTGITKDYNWLGGGGFKFYTLAPSLLQKDKYGNWVIDSQYNSTMLAAAMAKQEGFKYQPHDSLYWKQGTSSGQDFIYTTTQFITVESLDQINEEMQPGESLLICCKSFQNECKGKYGNITIKKIPQMLLGRCEFGKEDYSLNIVNMPIDDSNIETDIEEEITIQELSDKSKNKPNSQPTLFD